MNEWSSHRSIGRSCDSPDDVYQRSTLGMVVLPVSQALAAKNFWPKFSTTRHVRELNRPRNRRSTRVSSCAIISKSPSLLPRLAVCSIRWLRGSMLRADGTCTVSNERCTALGTPLYVAAPSSALYQAAERAVQHASDSLNPRARAIRDWNKTRTRGRRISLPFK